jgi:hypothetical protein
VPRLRNALELVLAAILELEPGAGDKIMRRRRHEHLAWSGAGGYARADMHRDAARLIATQTLDLAGVHARAHIEAELTQRVADFKRTADRARRTVEEGEESVAGRVDLFATESLELVSHFGVMLARAARSMRGRRARAHVGSNRRGQ